MSYLSLQRVQAIFLKDYREFSRNYAISIMVFVPIILAAFYNRMGIDPNLGRMMLTGLTLGLVTTFIQACLIAEEKEHHTLRNLLLSPASLLDILVGKSLLVLLITFISLGISFFFLSIGLNFWDILAILLCTLFYSALGTIAGLYANSTMEATITIIPVLIIFPFSPFLHLLENTFVIFKFAKWMPSSLLAEIMEGNSSWTNFGIIIGWVVIAWLIAIYFCKRRMIDE